MLHVIPIAVELPRETGRKTWVLASLAPSLSAKHTRGPMTVKLQHNNTVSNLVDMSTQEAAGIEFAILPEEHHQHFRLLELPPELLNVITASNASL